MVKRPYTTKGWELVWADEFDVDGHPTRVSGRMKKVVCVIMSRNIIQ